MTVNLAYNPDEGTYLLNASTNPTPGPDDTIMGGCCCEGEGVNHFWLGIASLTQVESESLSDYPYFAKQIRDIRLAVMAQRDYVPNLMDVFDDLNILEFGEK